MSGGGPAGESDFRRTRSSARPPGEPLAVPYVFALVTGEQIAYQIALVCLVGRITGDILQNILDGCYWKCGLFLGFEGPALFMLYTQAM